MESTPEEAAEGLAIVRVLAAVLDRLVCANSPLARTEPGQITKFHALKASDHPNLSGGISYVDSARHATYVKKSVFKKYSDKLMRRFGWKSFGTMHPPGPDVTSQRSPRSKPRPSTARRTSSSAM